jgi:hypothetical protein
MRRSSDRILVSHAGNLPRSDDLNRLLAAGERERVALNKCLPSAVAEVVERQIACGVDVVNDGEYVKAGSYTGYINQRLTGIEMQLADPNILALPFSPQLSAVFTDGVSGETPLCEVIVCHCESGRTLGVSPGEHVICNKQ